MEIKLRHRDGSTKTWKTKANNLYDGLKEILDTTQDDDDTGYFFDTEYANPDYVSENNVILFGEKGEVGIDLKNVVGTK